MIAIAVMLLGLGAAALGTTVAVGAATVSRLELNRWISQRLRGAAVASALYAAPGRMLRTANAVSAGGTLAVGVGMAALLRDLPPLVIAAVVALGGVPLIVAIAYAVPRAVGRRWSETLVRRATPWTERVAAIFRPIVPTSRESKPPQLVQTLLGGQTSEAPLREEVKVISGVMAFTERLVRDVMTPRTEIVALPEGVSLDEVARIFSESGYSRLPVYRDDLDNIVGMIYAFDLLKVTPGSDLPIRPVLVSPGSTECATLLLEMQRERRQFAVVLDEFGGTDGIVTLEDLLEELVGEIFDDDELATDGEGGTTELIEVDGTTSSAEVGLRFGVELPGNAETIGGLLAREAGRIPRPGERLTLRSLEFDVLAASPTRIERLAVRRGPVRATHLIIGHNDD